MTVTSTFDAPGCQSRSLAANFHGWSGGKTVKRPTTLTCPAMSSYPPQRTIVMRARAHTHHQNSPTSSVLGIGLPPPTNP